MGPKAQSVLSNLCDEDLSIAAFPFGTAQEIEIGRVPVRAIRMTYVGESGWELHVPMDQALSLYDTIMDAGQEAGLKNAGHYAINTMRLEKGYRAWGADISPDDTPLEAGLSFALDWNKPFMGRDTLLKHKQQKLTKRLVLFVLQEADAMLWGNEPILHHGKPVGYTTSGTYGYTVGGAIGMGYVKHDAGVYMSFIREGGFEIETNGCRVPAKAYLRSPYDPKREKIIKDSGQ
jgi:4-methylaminobutanoate oxidase (formaldehyde-forming)